MIEMRMGRVPKFCSGACRQKAYRARQKTVARLKRMSIDRWVRATGKRPIMPNGAPASSTNPSTWSTFEDVQSGAGDGLGVMMGDGLGCYDFDDCFDGDNLRGSVRDYIDAIQEPIIFIERSGSLKGLHVFVEMEPRRGKGFKLADGSSVEIYSKDRFIVCTFEKYGLR